jgi:hypothetical protein
MGWGHSLMASGRNITVVQILRSSRRSRQNLQKAAVEGNLIFYTALLLLSTVYLLVDFSKITRKGQLPIRFWYVIGKGYTKDIPSSNRQLTLSRYFRKIN